MQHLQRRINRRFFVYAFSWLKIYFSLLTQDFKHLSMGVKFNLDRNQCREANSKTERKHYSVGDLARLWLLYNTSFRLWKPGWSTKVVLCSWDHCYSVAMWADVQCRFSLAIFQISEEGVFPSVCEFWSNHSRIEGIRSCFVQKLSHTGIIKYHKPGINLIL